MFSNGLICTNGMWQEAPAATAPTTTVSPEVKGDTAVLFAMANMEQKRDELIGIMKDSLPSDGSVDLFDTPKVLDNTPTISPLRLGITSGWATDEHQQDEAWNQVRILSTFWKGSGGFRNDAGKVHVPLTLIIDGRTYDQSYETMVALADSRMLRTDWAASVGL